MLSSLALSAISVCLAGRNIEKELENIITPIMVCCQVLTVDKYKRAILDTMELDMKRFLLRSLSDNSPAGIINRVEATPPTVNTKLASITVAPRLFMNKGSKGDTRPLHREVATLTVNRT